MLMQEYKKKIGYIPKSFTLLSIMSHEQQFFSRSSLSLSLIVATSFHIHITARCLSSLRLFIIWRAKFENDDCILAKGIFIFFSYTPARHHFC